METKWSDLGFLGSVLLTLFGFLFLIIYYLPPLFFGSSAFAVAMLLAFLGMLGGIFLCLGFLGFRVVLNAPGPWLTFITIIWSLAAWLLYFGSQVLIILGNVLGLILWFWSNFGLMITFIIWGFVLYNIRTKLGPKSPFALGAALCFLINGIGWLSFMGFGILALGGLLCTILFAPAPKFSIFSPLVRVFTDKRVRTLSLMGPLLLTIYSLLALKWLINGLVPLPVAIAAFLNLLSLLAGWFAVLGMALVINGYAKTFENRILGWALLAWIPSMLLLTLSDFQWLMSNLTVMINPGWGLVLYQQVALFVVWSSIPLALWSFLMAVAFLQIYRSPETQGDLHALLLHIFLLITCVLWILGYGYLGLIPIGIFLWNHWKRLAKYHQ